MRYAFLVLMCVFAGLYAGAKRSGSFASRLAFKTIASVSFVMIAFLGRLGADKTYYVLIMIGLCFALVGDVLLVFSDKKATAAGGAAFLFAHISYIAAFFVWAQPAWYDAALFCAFALAGIILLGRKLRRLGKVGLFVVVYGFALCAMTAKTVSMLFVAGLNPVYAAFAALGGVLFALSDLLLAHAHFHPDERGTAAATSVIIYYVAQAFIALSVAL